MSLSFIDPLTIPGLRVVDRTTSGYWSSLPGRLTLLSICRLKYLPAVQVRWVRESIRDCSQQEGYANQSKWSFFHLVHAPCAPSSTALAFLFHPPDSSLLHIGPFLLKVCLLPFKHVSSLSEHFAFWTVILVAHFHPDLVVIPVWITHSPCVLVSLGRNKPALSYLNLLHKGGQGAL